tara:strand:+ start:7164 stop:8597 length:1434 start_codon:yes stop_codon:yes gene_type:complete
MANTKSNTQKANSITKMEATLPYSITFEKLDFKDKPVLPHLQSYASTISKDGFLVLLGGRWQQGLHQFEGNPHKNFDPSKSNKNIYVIDPTTGNCWCFDTNHLSPEYYAPIQATNQQAYHDRSTDFMYLVGGYGWKADKSDMRTFNTIIRFKVEALVTAIKSTASVTTVQELFSISNDDRFAITGGELFKMGNIFYLIFGQIFNGQYSAFGGADFYQVYSEEIRTFTLKPNSLEILNYGAQTSDDDDHPFHRRDGNTIEAIDPTSGKPRITALGGVFPPGIIGGYTYPIYIYGTEAPNINRDVIQKFSQYECPVISVYDDTDPTMYHTFFGGISHYYYAQTEAQKNMYEAVSKEGRNDGLPFISDITTFLQNSEGQYAEYLHKEPILDHILLGASSKFMVDPSLFATGNLYENGVIKLSSFTKNERYLVGYIFGGIGADFPLPKIPNQGTAATNTLIAVYLTYKPSEVISADLGKEA